MNLKTLGGFSKSDTSTICDKMRIKRKAKGKKDQIKNNTNKKIKK